MRRFFKGERGSVSVMLIVIIVPVFLFHALLIDVLRLKAAGRAAEKSLQAAARSVLSRYDASLQPYGLYAFDRSDQDAPQLLQSIFAQNAAPAGDSGYFRLIDWTPEPDGYVIDGMRTLGNAVVLRDQLLQEMKVRAPLEYGFAIAQKFKQSGAAAEMSASAGFYERSAKLDELIGRRERTLDDAWPEVLEFRGATAAFHTKYDQRLKHLNELSDRLVGTANDDSKQSVESLQPSTSNGQNSGQRVREAAEYQALLQTTKLELANEAVRFRSMNDSIAERVEQARTINAEIEAERDRIVGDSPVERAPRVPAEELFQAVPIYPQDYFSAFKTGTGKTVSLISGLQAYWPAIFMSGERYDDLLRSNDALLQHTEQFIAEQEPKEQARRKRNDSIRDEKQAERSTIDQALQTVKAVAGSCGSGPEAYADSYGRLTGKNGLYAKYSNYNEVADADSPAPPGFSLDNADEAGKSAMSWTRRFTEMALTARDEIYVDEYVLTKFGYRTLTQSADLSQPALRPLQRQEVEYLLYGFGSCTANHAAAYAEMFGALFAIRTAESLMKPVSAGANLGTPLLAFLAAAAEGAVQAAAEMNQLVRGEAVPVFRKWPKVTVEYKDFLRIFLLLQSNDDKLTARLQGLIELNTGADLTMRATMLRASAKASVRYWFMPSVMSGLQAAGLLQGATNKDRLILDNFAVLSY